MAGTLLSAVGSALLVLGLLLATIGLYGLLRRPDLFHQLHPAGLVTGPATILVLLAAIGTRRAEIITSAALVLLFVLITSPLSSHAIAQTAYRRRKHAPPADEREPAERT
jgi:multicomponent Na+:H+ antiporter subunit G